MNREFLGNYSCRGYNAAGWGDESDAKLLDVLYEPGNASISVYPAIPLKRKSMQLLCSVEDAGNPKSTRFHWLRGDDPVKDIVTAEWTIVSENKLQFTLRFPSHGPLYRHRIPSDYTVAITFRAMLSTTAATAPSPRLTSTCKWLRHSSASCRPTQASSTPSQMWCFRVASSVFRTAQVCFRWQSATMSFKMISIPQSTGSVTGKKSPTRTTSTSSRKCHCQPTHRPVTSRASYRNW